MAAESFEQMRKRLQAEYEQKLAKFELKAGRVAAAEKRMSSLAKRAEKLINEYEDLYSSLLAPADEEHPGLTRSELNANGVKDTKAFFIHLVDAAAEQRKTLEAETVSDASRQADGGSAEAGQLSEEDYEQIARSAEENLEQAGQNMQSEPQSSWNG